MKRLMRYKTLQCFLAALVMIAFLAPSAYASGAPDTYEASANAVSEKYIGKTVPGACVVISEHDNTVFAKGYGFADLENNTAMDPETTVFECQKSHPSHRGPRKGHRKHGGKATKEGSSADD